MIGIHLLGAADLGVKPDDYPAALDELLGEGPKMQAERLARAHRSEPHQAALSPLGSFLYHSDPHISRVWLVATRQEPPHPLDTLRLAEVIASSLADRPALFGTEITAEVISVRGFGLDAMADAVRRRIESAPEPRASVVIGIGSGSTENLIGLLMGCIASGVVPRLCTTNRHDVNSSTHTFDLLIERDMSRWLVRTGAFAALAELDPDPEREKSWRLLEAVQHLDWEAARSVAKSLPEGATTGLTPPKTACGRVPAHREEWDFYRSILESLLLRRLGVGEMTGLFLACPWVVMECRRLFEDLRRRGSPMLASGVERLVREASEWGAMDFEPLIKRLKKDRAFSSRFSKLPDSRFKEFLQNSAWRKLWTLGARAGHGHAPPNAETAIKNTQFLDQPSRTDPLAEVLAGLGYQPWPLLPGEGRLVIQCVGQRDLDPNGWTPMLDAIEHALREKRVPPEHSHLRLVASDETYDAAAHIAGVAEGRGLCSAVIGPVPVADYQAIRKCVDAALRSKPELEAVSDVLVATNPGTKAMNLGALAAALQWGFDVRRPVSVAPLQAKDGGTRLLDEGPTARHGLRLAHDQAVADVVCHALDDLDFGLAKEILRAGSNHWDGLDVVVDELERITNKSDEVLLPMGSHGEPQRLQEIGRRGDWPKNKKGAVALGWSFLNAADLWPARMTLYSTIIDRHPWRAIYQISAVAERCWPKPKPDDKNPAPWRTNLQPVCLQIWRWRNDSPFGHKVWACPPPKKDIHDAFRQAAKELVDTELVPENHVERTALVSLRNELREYLRRLPAGN